MKVSTGKRTLGLDADGGPTPEISISGEGPIKGKIESTDMWTYWTLTARST
ncbi:MAG: hypothetical protein WBX01_14450 [Nitrososphaeraceae archaeon]|jgi:hypothetical protein